MRLRTIAAILATWFLTSCGGGGALDGGQSGTGLSTIRGNVVAAPGQTLDPSDIRVSLSATDLETLTDQAGRFELRGDVSGPGELRFERDRDALFAATDVLVPAGGVLELAEIAIDRESGEALPALRRVEFEGFVESLDCTGGRIFVIPKEDAGETVFLVETASATIRHDNQLLSCDDLRIDDRVQIDAETADGVTLVNADVRLEDRESENESDDEDDGSEDDEAEDDSAEKEDGEDDSEDDAEDGDSEDDEDEEDDSAEKEREEGDSEDVENEEDDD